jgi:hypothetical protein
MKFNPMSTAMQAPVKAGMRVAALNPVLPDITELNKRVESALAAVASNSTRRNATMTHFTTGRGSRYRINLDAADSVITLWPVPSFRNRWWGSARAAWQSDWAKIGQDLYAALAKSARTQEASGERRTGAK